MQHSRLPSRHRSLRATGVLFAAVLGGFLASELPAQTETARHLLYRFDGASPGAWSDLKVRGAGDLDRDGYADVIVGAPKDGTHGAESGRVDVLSGRDGSLLYRFEGFKTTWDRFGWSVDGGRDVDLDGHPDLAAGAWGHDKNGSKSGVVQVFSGRTGQVIWTFYGDAADDFLGESVRLIGDMDRDGHAEIAAGAPQNPNGTGYVRIYSGRTGAAILTVKGSFTSGTFGHGLGTLNDIDFDLRPDFAVGAPGEATNGKDSGALYVFSGTGKLLKRLVGANAGDAFGWDVDATRDVNGDGQPDLITSAPFANQNAGYAQVLSGRDFSVIRTTNGQAGDELGRMVSFFGDLENDGMHEYAIGSRPAAKPGYAVVIDGATGKERMRFVGQSVAERFGYVVGGPGDVNGDGVPDLAVGVLDRGPGSVEIYSGKALTLSADRHVISVTQSEKQMLQLSGGRPNALFCITGSISDTRPGTWITGVHVPLNLFGDIYFPLTLEYANGPFLTNSLGYFDAQGRAQASFNGSPAQTVMLGIRIDHAWVQFGGVLLDAASNPVPLRLVQ